MPGNHSANNKRIAKNTVLLYIRMGLLLLISLYTSRVVLQKLGVTDFGVYTAVAGFMTMFAGISSSISAAISRFITYELGKGDFNKLARIFSTSLIIQICIAAAIVFLAEIIGVCFLNSRMNIPPDRLVAANWVFQFSIATFVVNLISVPYNATIIAHEHMSAFAYISILETVCRLSVAFFIGIVPIDNLVCYSFLLFLVALVIRITYGFYCRRHFCECQFRRDIEKSLFKQIFSFAGWNFIGSFSGIVRDQGVNILLNLFCGPIVNAAQGIALQVRTAVGSFSSGFTTAINPQITKSFAAGNDKEYVWHLVFRGAKFCFFLMLLVSMPILAETEWILRLWLGDYPDYTVAFTRICVLYILIEALSMTMVTLMLATGKIRNYQIVVGGCQLLNFPIAYIVLRLGSSPTMAIGVSCVIGFINCFLRMHMLNRMISFPIGQFVKKSLVPAVAVFVMASIPPLVLRHFLASSINRLVGDVIMCVVITSILIYVMGCTRSERLFIKNRVFAIASKVSNKFQR